MERDAVTRLSTASRNTTQVCPAAEANGSRDGHDARRAAGGTQAEADGVNSAVLMGGDAVTRHRPRSGEIQSRRVRPAAEANGSGEGYGCDGALRAGVDSPIEPWKEAMRGRAFETAKLASDLVGASILLIVLSPVMLLIAMAIRLESPARLSSDRSGRAFWTSLHPVQVPNDARRCGERRGPVSRQLAPRAAAFKIREDPRVTRVGAILRAWSLDEIQNLFNVLLRNMSLVGPRPTRRGPETYEELAAASAERPARDDRTRPGGGAVSDLQFPEQVRLDLRYIRERSLWLDLRILGRTVLAVLVPEGRLLSRSFRDSGAWQRASR